MNKYYIWRFDQSWFENAIGAVKGENKYNRFPTGRDRIYQKALDRGRAIENAIIIDLNCRKFAVKGIVTRGFERDVFNLFGLIGERRYYFSFVTEFVEQMTFEEAREEITEHICSHRWVGQTGGTPAQFRKLQATRRNMAELIEGIAFYGKWTF